MAFKTLEKQKLGKALDMADQKKPVIGFIMGRKGNIGAEKNSSIYHLEDEKGKKFDLWGCFDIDSSLLTLDKVNPQFLGKLARFTFRGLRPVEGKDYAAKEVDVEIDMDKVHSSIKGFNNSKTSGRAKDYLLKNGKTA